jgi:hypothetical protein
VILLSLPSEIVFRTAQPQKVLIKEICGDLTGVRNALEGAGYLTLGDMITGITGNLTLNRGDTLTIGLPVAGYDVMITQDGDRVQGKISRRSSPGGPKRISRLALSVGGRLLPAAERDRWLEEWTNQLSELSTRRARARITISLVTAGIPKLALTLRRAPTSRKRAWPAS